MRPGLLSAQETGETGDRPTRERAVLTGVVRDGSGGPLRGASVAIPDLGRGRLTDGEGRFRLDGLPARRVTVRVRMLGRKTVVREIELRAGGTTRIEVTLEPRPLEGQEITVTGTPTARDPLRATQEVDVVSSRQIGTRTTVSLGGLLEETVPGVTSIRTGAQAGKPVLRGLSGSRIRVLQNGVAQEYFQYGVRHFPPTSTTQAEQVEVVRGASSILYGSDALGGAVNVVTKDLPSAAPGETRFGGRVRVPFATGNEARGASVDVEGARGNVGFRAGMQRREANDFEAPAAPTFFETGEAGAPKYTGSIPFTNFDQWSAYGQVGMQGGFGSAQLFADHWRNDQNFLLPTGGPEGDPDNPPVGLGQHLEQTNVTAKATVATGGLVWKPTFNYQRALRQSAAPGDTIEADPDFPIDLAKDVFTLRLETLHPDLGPLSGTLGAELRIQDTEARGPVELEPSSTILNLGVFAFEDVDLEPVTLSAGLRFDYREQDADRNDRTEDPDLLRQTFRELSGGVGASWEFVEGLALAGNFNAGFRAPNMFELFAVGVEGGVAAFQRGNPELDSERSFSVDLGLRVRRDRVQGKVTGYWNRIRDFVFLERTGEVHAPSGLPIFARGQTDATLRGVEGSLHFAVRPWLELGTQGALQDTEGDGLGDPIPGTDGERGDGERGDGELPLIPADRLGGHVQVTPELGGLLQNPRLKLSVEHVFQKDAAGRFEPFSQFDDTPFGTASTEEYTLLGLQAGTTLTVGPRPVSLDVSVENLTDEVHRDFLDTYKGYALSQGRNVKTQLTVPF